MKRKHNSIPSIKTIDNVIGRTYVLNKSFFSLGIANVRR